MNQQQNNGLVGVKDYRDDDIDLMELFVVLWRGKWLILVYVVISAVMAAVYIYTAPVVYKGSLEIKPLLANDMLRYHDMNEQQIMMVSAEVLLGRFITDLETRDGLREAFKKSLSQEGIAAGSGEALDDEALRLAYSIDIVPPTDPESKKGNQKKYWTLEFETSDVDALKEVVWAASNTSTQAAHKFYLDKYNHLLAYEEAQAQRSIEDVERKIELKLASYDEKTAQHLAFLEEQAILARALDLEKSSVENQVFASSISAIAGLELKAPFYMRGYKAIEKEIELLKAREDTSLYVSELVGLNEELRSLKASKKVERFKEAVEASPLVFGDFKAIRIDLDGMVFKSSKRASLIVALSIIIGGMVGVVAVVIQAGVRSYRSRQAY